MADFLATNDFAGTGAVMQVEINFAGVRPDLPDQPNPYLEDSDVKGVIITPATPLTVETSVPVALVKINDNTFTTAPATVAIGKVLRVYRDTDIEFPLVDYVSLQVVSESDLDNQSRQTLYAVMESRDNSSIAVYKANAASATAVAANITANSANAKSDAAVATANAANELSAQAVATANSAVETADAASVAAAEAVSTANEAEAKVDGVVEEALDIVNEATGRFLPPSATEPATRPGGAALQVGDRYLNTASGIEFIYKDGAWAANNLDGTDLANSANPLLGAALVGYDHVSVAQQLNLSRKVESYEDLRAYSGSAVRIQVTAPGLLGDFQDLGIGGAPLVNGMFIKDADDRVWGRVYNGDVESSWFETVGNGIADDTAAFQAFWSFLSTYGLTGHVQSGLYAISAQVLTTLTNSFEVYVSPNAEFLATIGFPSAAGMFALGNAITAEKKTFKWIGGRFNGVNQPYTAVGTGSGCTLLTVNASNCSHCHVEIDRTYTGADWMTTGGDTHLFIGGPSNVFARVYEAIGAPDSAIYCSRNIDGTVGEVLDVDGNFYKCKVGVIVKRRFETARVRANGVDCITVAATGTANTTTEAIADCGSGYIFEVNAKRCQTPLFLQAVRGVRAVVNVDKLGVNIPGYASVDGAAVRLRGASDCNIEVNTSGITSGLTVTNDFVAAFLGDILVSAGTINSLNNRISINGRGPGKPFTEDGAGTNNNTIVGKWDSGLTNLPTIIGALTVYDIMVGNLRLFNHQLRKVDSAGNIVFDLASSGSLSVGARNTGVAAPWFLDTFTSGGATRNGRLLASGGSGSADSGTLSVQYAQTTLTGAAVDIVGVLRSAVDAVAIIGQKTRRFLSGYFQNLFVGPGDCLITGGVGTPEGVVVAVKGSVYLNNGAGASLWYKNTGTGNTGWVSIT